MIKKVILLILIIGTLVGGAIYIQPNDARMQEIPQQRTTAERPKAKTLGVQDIGTPKKLSIPKLQINAPIEPVGLTKQGDMDVPSDGNLVGWYEHGVVPGKPGNAVLDGHLNVEGQPAVFRNLSRLTIGDTLTVTDDKRQDLKFVVTYTAVFDPQHAPLERIFGHSDKPQLNLITCGGTWDKTTKTYSKRVVVFTELQK